MIDIKENPTAVLTLNDGDVVSFGEIELVTSAWSDDRVYFTTADSPGLTNNVRYTHAHVADDYGTLYKHLRRSDVSNKAVMAREEVVEIIQNGGYYIG